MKKIKLSGFTDEISSDLIEQLEEAKRVGLDAVCLRKINERNIVEYSLKEVQQWIKPLLGKYGLTVSSIGSPLGKIPIEDEKAYEKQLILAEHTCNIAKLLNCKYIRIFSFYMPNIEESDVYEEIVIKKLKGFLSIFEKYGIVALHENEKDIYGDSVAHCNDLFTALQSQGFGAIFDFANFVQCDENPLEGFRILEPYIRYYHISDALNENCKNVICGTGDGNIEKILKLAIENGYEGYCTLEPHQAVCESLKNSELKAGEEILKNSKESDGKNRFHMQYEAFNKILNRINMR